MIQAPALGAYLATLLPAAPAPPFVVTVSSDAHVWYYHRGWNEQRLRDELREVEL